jgi:NaMN:DMB phosphoribosyltransferase
MNVVAGASGLALIAMSDTPSKKGATKQKVPAIVDGGAAVAAAAAAASSPVEVAGLPAAPSEFHLYTDRGVTRMLLMQDCKWGPKH